MLGIVKRWTVLVLLLGVAACGTPELTGEEKLAVAEARRDFALTVLDGSRYAQTIDGVDRLIAIYRAKPDAEYDGLTMREVLQDAASDLEPYRPQLAARLDRAAG